MPMRLSSRDVADLLHKVKRMRHAGSVDLLIGDMEVPEGDRENLPGEELAAGGDNPSVAQRATTPELYCAYVIGKASGLDWNSVLFTLEDFCDGLLAEGNGQLAIVSDGDCLARTVAEHLTRDPDYYRKIREAFSSGEGTNEMAERMTKLAAKLFKGLSDDINAGRRNAPRPKVLVDLDCVLAHEDTVDEEKIGAPRFGSRQWLAQLCWGGNIVLRTRRSNTSVLEDYCDRHGIHSVASMLIAGCTDEKIAAQNSAPDTIFVIDRSVLLPCGAWPRIPADFNERVLAAARD